MTDFAELYQEIIHDHAFKPKNRATLDPAIPLAENPSCGDKVRIAFHWDLDPLDPEARITGILFDGSGCSISMASTSMLSEILPGKTRADALRTIAQVLEVFRGDAPPETFDDFGDLTALKGIVHLPVRVKCATLAWNAARKALL